MEIGLILTITWLVVLFVGSAFVSKSKIRNSKRWLISILVAIPALYILFWLFS
ncbi:MAG: hypothetical protein RLZZ579_479 [Actinomycetota bacterium]